MHWMVQIPVGIGYPAGVISGRLLGFEAYHEHMTSNAHLQQQPQTMTPHLNSPPARQRRHRRAHGEREPRSQHQLPHTALPALGTPKRHRRRAYIREWRRVDRREGAHIIRAVRLSVRTPGQGYPQSMYRRLQPMVKSATRKTRDYNKSGGYAAYLEFTVRPQEAIHQTCN